MAIGVFDSGIGGLTVYSSIIEKFESLDVYYLGDTARVPYGNKSEETICRYSLECANFLIEQFDISCLVVACNTASSFALNFLRSKVSIPVIGVVDPGAKQAAYFTKNKKIGVIGTIGTIKSNSYSKSIKNLDPSIEIYQNPAPLLVPLVEEGRINHKITKLALKEYIQPLVNKGVDTLVLGCTHYPVLKEEIHKLYPELILIDSSLAVLPEIEKCIDLSGGDTAKRLIFTTDRTEAFELLKQRIVGDIKSEKVDLKEFV
ncbi:MAG: murI [Deferribacteraceae bacterium]|jgi:glutamate racemase|nr:murI [Deferribacteraceae bacterium]